MTNGAYGSRSHDGHWSNRDDMVRDGRFLDTLDKRGDEHGFYSYSGSDRYHGHHRYHHYKRNGRGYLLNDFKKSKPPTFDGELKKPKNAEAW